MKSERGQFLSEDIMEEEHFGESLNSEHNNTVWLKEVFAFLNQLKWVEFKKFMTTF